MSGESPTGQDWSDQEIDLIVADYFAMLKRETDASSYVEDLIRQDRERAEAAERLKAMITEGFESGISDLQVEEIWERVKADGING